MRPAVNVNGIWEVGGRYYLATSPDLSANSNFDLRLPTAAAFYTPSEEIQLRQANRQMLYPAFPRQRFDWAEVLQLVKRPELLVHAYGPPTVGSCASLEIAYRIFEEGGRRSGVFGQFPSIKSLEERFSGKGQITSWRYKDTTVSFASQSESLKAHKCSIVQKSSQVLSDDRQGSHSQTTSFRCQQHVSRCSV